MLQWHVELISKDTVLLDFLTTCLREPTCTVIERQSKRYYALEKDGQLLYRTSDLPTTSEDKHYYWLSSDFEQFPVPQDVHRYASQQLPLLNSITRLKYGDRISSLNIDDVYLPDEQDRLIKHTATFPPLTGRLVTSESKLQAGNAQPPTIAALWQMAHKDTVIEEVMNYFANQRNWFNLYKIYEAIELDVGKDIVNQWMNGQADDFTYSANNARVAGLEARHASARFHKVSTKCTPMSLPEATAFVTQLIFQWLQTK